MWACRLQKHFQNTLKRSDIGETKRLFDELNTTLAITSRQQSINQTKLKHADFVIIAVPTSVTKAKYPNMELVEHASKIIGQNRSINDSMPKYVAEMTIKGLNKVGKAIKGSRVLIIGLTYTADVPDIRESPV